MVALREKPVNPAFRKGWASPFGAILRIFEKQKENLMELLQPIVQRRAARAFSGQAVPREILEKLAKAAVLAPSCANAQPWRFVTATGSALEELKNALSDGNYWGKKAGAITAVVTHPDWDARLDHGRDYAFFDTGMAVMNYQLQAIHEGLLAHVIAGFDVVKAKAALGIPESAVLLTLVLLGYEGSAEHLNDRHKAAEKAERSRKPLEEVYTYDAWKASLLPKAKE